MKSSNKWVPLTLEGPIVNSSLEGLIGIEELSNYDSNTVVNTKNKKRNLKRKLSNEEPSKVEKVLDKPKKKKKKVVAGLFVRNPNLIQDEAPKIADKNVKKVKQSKNKKLKTEAVKNDDVFEVNVENDVDLKAWDIFSLPKPILRALADLKFTKPTPIQENTLPSAILGRRDILGAAETGSGKTLAFGLPILTGILAIKEKESENLENQENDSDEEEVPENENEVFKKQKPLYALILTPTRELAIQVNNHLTAVAKYTGIRTAVVVGGLASEKQERLLSKGPEIVVATPGRLWELIQNGNLHLSQLENIRYLAIDETDRMLEKGHFIELHQLLERLNMDEIKRQKRQNFVFSATLTLVHDLPSHLLIKKKLAGQRGKKILKLTPKQKLQKIIEMLGITDPKIFDMSKEGGISQNLTECRITCAIEEKDFYVYYFLKKHPGLTLIFCNSIGCVKRLATLLGLLGCGSLPLHATMAQRQRLKNLERFRDNENGVLIATDVAARGLDIPNVEHVIHYQTPRTVESYVHRSGRTARATKLGLTMLLIEPTEVNDYRKLCQSLNKTEDLPAFPVEERYLNAVKLRVKLARKLDTLELKMKRSNAEKGWLQKAAQEMELIIDGQSDSENEEFNESVELKRQITSIRKELTSLLTKPLFPQGFSFKYPTSMSASLLSNALDNQPPASELSALQVVQQEIKRKDKTKNVRKLYKPKLTIAEKKAERRTEKKQEKRNKRKAKKEKMKNKFNTEDDV